MIRNGCINVYGIYCRIFQQFIIIRVPFLNIKSVTRFIKTCFVTLAYCIHVSIGMTLIYRNKFGAKTQTNNSYINFCC